MKLQTYRIMLRNRLAQAGIATADLDARILIQHGAKIESCVFLTNPAYMLSKAALATIDNFITRRLMGEPVAMITGERGFWDLKIKVTADVLEPRPDSETLIELILDYITQKACNNDKLQRYNILDCGTGSGCLLLALLQSLPNSTGCGLDISAPALKVASQNAQRNGLQARSQFVQSNWFSQWHDKVDIIVANPPYIPRHMLVSLANTVKDYDPLIALDGGDDGLDAYRVIANQAGCHLNPNGILALEFGQGQSYAIETLFSAHDWRVLAVRKDLQNMERAMILTLK